MIKTFITCVLLASLATAGFCDYKSHSSYYCDGSKSKYCDCNDEIDIKWSFKEKKKKSKSYYKSYKFKYGRRLLAVDCDKQSEIYCQYGCISGRCMLPPTLKPDHLQCASSKISPLKFTEDIFKHTLGIKSNISHSLTLLRAYQLCPMISNYTLWRDRQNSVALMEASLELVTEDIQWWDNYRLKTVVTNVSHEDRFANYSQLAVKFPELETNWIKLKCPNNNRDYTCRYAFPECRSRATNDPRNPSHAYGFTENCMTSCEGMDACISAYRESCIEISQKADYLKYNITCLDYGDLFAHHLDDDGKRKCKDFCGMYQNNFIGDPNTGARGSPLFLGLIFSVFGAVAFVA